MPKKSGETPSYRVTSAGVNPAEDRAHRMRMYFIAMTLRVACVLSLFWVSGWWLIIPAIGSVVLPWFAVMVGNAVAYGGEEEVAVPDPLELSSGDDPAGAQQEKSSPELLIVDVEPVRRAAARPAPAADPMTSSDASEAEPPAAHGASTGTDTRRDEDTA
ncbi:DUF3099 domain-containing protein [Leucobacter komagatae]|uniref:DUF3099 domain-containing protein n=1 Tax=Leucobacter komagatae TaxID=55969 RepID=UPI000A8281A7|nr:DUF3099 domain-containing protein [Leucobacter komagatae]